jgi:hypothetical protein
MCGASSLQCATTLVSRTLESRARAFSLRHLGEHRHVAKSRGDGDDAAMAKKLWAESERIVAGLA